MARQGRLADLERFAAQVGAVKLEQIESEEEGDGLVATATQDIKPGEPGLIAANDLADRTLRWVTASTTSGKRSDQSLPRRVIRRMPTESLRAIRR